jgi:hypothetical protein
MPKPSWEQSNNAAFFGYLKFSDFQTSQGLDVHVTFQKDQKAHISVYELGGKKKGGNFWLDKATYGLSLNIMDWWVLAATLGGGMNAPLPTVTGYKSYREFFETEINVKAVELGIISQKPGLVPNALPKTDLSSTDDAGFPAL